MHRLFARKPPKSVIWTSADGPRAQREDPRRARSHSLQSRYFRELCKICNPLPPAGHSGTQARPAGPQSMTGGRGFDAFEWRSGAGVMNIFRAHVQPVVGPRLARTPSAPPRNDGMDGLILYQWQLGLTHVITVILRWPRSGPRRMAAEAQWPVALRGSLRHPHRAKRDGDAAALAPQGDGPWVDVCCRSYYSFPSLPFLATTISGASGCFMPTM